MLPTFIILFREVLEMAIIVGIILAATQGIPHRGKWVLFGMIGGAAGSAVVAFSADAISSAMEGMGQEVLNATILIIAAALIGWTVVWMRRHARELSARLRKVGQDVTDGTLPLYSIALVVCLAMWREGAEIVLFMVGVLSTTQESMLAIIAGGVSGAAMAALIGFGMYTGLVKLPIKYMFSVSGWLLVLLTCGMAAQACGYLIQAGMVPELTYPLWDSSHILSDSSLVGRILSGMIGYTDRPAGMQVVWYGATFLVLAALMQLSSKMPARKQAVNAAISN